MEMSEEDFGPNTFEEVFFLVFCFSVLIFQLFSIFKSASEIQRQLIEYPTLRKIRVREIEIKSGG